MYHFVRKKLKEECTVQTKYTMPEIQVVSFAAEDIVTASSGGNINVGGWGDGGSLGGGEAVEG